MGNRAANANGGNRGSSTAVSGSGFRSNFNGRKAPFCADPSPFFIRAGAVLMGYPSIKYVDDGDGRITVAGALSQDMRIEHQLVRCPIARSLSS